MFKLFNKDLKLFFNDRRSYILTFLLPLILIVLFTFAYGGIEKYSGGAKSFNLIITDNDSTELSNRFISVLDSLNGIDIHTTDIQTARLQIIKGRFSSALILHKGFSDSLLMGRNIPIELLYDKEQNFEVGMLQSLVISIISTFSSRIQDFQSVMLPQTKTANTDTPLLSEDSRESSSLPVLKMTSIVGSNEDLNLGLIQAVAGTAILMLLFSVAGIGTSILEEKENGTIMRLLFSPLNLRTILYSKMLFAFFISIIQLTVMFLFSWIFLDLDITINPGALILMILSTSLAVSSIGIFLAAIAKSRQQAQSLSTLIILVMSAIGGSMIPLFIMPEIMSKMAVISVNYWSIQGFYDIFWRMLPIGEIMPRILILTGVAVVFSILSIRLFSKNIMKIV